jgi:hypothetical protein
MRVDSGLQTISIGNHAIMEAAMKSNVERTFENRLRRMAHRQGFAVRKSRRRDPQACDFEGYMIADRETGLLIAGADPLAFSFTADDVYKFLTERHREDQNTRYDSINRLISRCR